MMKKSTFLAVCLWLAAASCTFNNEEELYGADERSQCGDLENISFQAFVEPLIESRCSACHSNAARRGGISLEGYSNVLIQANNGKLVGSIRHDPGFSAMPQGGQKLPECDIERIAAWVEAGAPDN